jgi:hypothetical protein
MRRNLGKYPAFHGSMPESSCSNRIALKTAFARPLICERAAKNTQICVWTLGLASSFLSAGSSIDPILALQIGDTCIFPALRSHALCCSDTDCLFGSNHLALAFSVHMSSPLYREREHAAVSASRGNVSLGSTSGRDRACEPSASRSASAPPAERGISLPPAGTCAGREGLSQCVFVKTSAAM